MVGWIGPSRVVLAICVILTGMTFQKLYTNTQARERAQRAIQQARSSTSGIFSRWTSSPAQMDNQSETETSMIPAQVRPPMDMRKRKKVETRSASIRLKVHDLCSHSLYVSGQRKDRLTINRAKRHACSDGGRDVTTDQGSLCMYQNITLAHSVTFGPRITDCRLLGAC